MTKIKLSLDKYSGNIDTRFEYLSETDIFNFFTDSFMSRYTKHNNFTDFCNSIGCDMTLQNDIDNLQDGKMDDQISTQSDFESWNDMAETAYHILFNKK